MSKTKHGTYYICHIDQTKIGWVMCSLCDDSHNYDKSISI